MKMNLERGDKCFVRIYGGAVVEANYLYKARFSEKSHVVSFGGNDYLACDSIGSESYCRLVYPLSEMKRQMGLQ